jgi:hypothetical protein
MAHEVVCPQKKSSAFSKSAVVAVPLTVIIAAKIRVNFAEEDF